MEAVQFKLLLWIFLIAFLLIMPSVQGTNFHYCSNRNHTVKITEVTVFPDPVFRGNLVTYTISAFTDQVILGGEMLIDISYYSFHIHSGKLNLCDETLCPISSGEFWLSLSQVLPVYAAPGSYNLQMKLLGKDGRQLSCVTFDFTVRYPQLMSDS